MQTGFFYVRLKADPDLTDRRVHRRGAMLSVDEVLTKERAYPVLAVELRQSSSGEQTLYHIPADDNEIDWLPADLFVFARE